MNEKQIMNELMHFIANALEGNEEYVEKEDFHKFIHDEFWKAIKNSLSENYYKKFVNTIKNLDMNVSVFKNKISIYFSNREGTTNFSILEILQSIK